MLYLAKLKRWSGFRSSRPKLFLNISQNLQKISCEFSKTFKNTFFCRTTPPVAASRFQRAHMLCWLFPKNFQSNADFKIISFKTSVKKTILLYKKLITSNKNELTKCTLLYLKFFLWAFVSGFLPWFAN